MKAKPFTLFKLMVAFIAIAVIGCWHVTNSPSSAKIKVEVRLAEHAPQPNYHEMELYGTKVKVYMTPEIYFSNSDIKYAKAELEMGTVMENPIIILKLTPDASERFAKFSKDNYNKSVAIIFDDKVMATPIIRDTMSAGIVYFTGRFTLEEAKVFSKQINGR